ncbi:MAG: aldehyde dehydrogenase family protein [Nitrospinota bacterium]|jgi:aldehyde dehydrogenase (NAD+)|nr:aldehyde dehydrogenase family protein [Nitrospinota bacterium]MDP7371012.1 aldehyde dehydrogenase family protein [Nitrospinota bacterium]MDP7505540.1 aldehyde dehydrogenase family protein [Nitrospinota bacterium]
MVAGQLPREIPNWIGGKQLPAAEGKAFEKLNPATGARMCMSARSGVGDVREAVAAAKRSQPAWAERTPVERGRILLDVAIAMRGRQKEIAAVVAEETGKSPGEALGETGGAIQLAEFFAGEGMRMYGRTLTSGTPRKYAMTVRQPVGVVGLIIAANTPIANVAWKVFPALVCGNGAVLKSAEDTPATAWIFSLIAHEAGLPPGVLNVVHGYGEEAGAPLVEHEDVGVVSFTGSTRVGRLVAVAAGRRLAKVSLELGGKNPLVVCDDADLDNAVKWTALSSFSNAGQRCAASSRIIVFDAVYEKFRDLLVERTGELKVGPANDDDFGPVINERQLSAMLEAIESAEGRGARVAAGGRRIDDPAHASGFYIAPTVLENVAQDDELSNRELFGPIAVLYRVKDFAEAVGAVNDNDYGLTAAIHTKNVDRAVQFTRQVRAGAVNVNAGTYGSEPHYPFGGFGVSGNGSREPGVEALDVYSETKTISFTVDPGNI